MIIAHTNTPVFEYNDKPYAITTRRLKHKQPFVELAEILKTKEEQGYTHCVIYSLGTAPIEQLNDYLVDGSPPIFVRWEFLKVEETDEIVLGRNMKKIEKLLVNETEQAQRIIEILNEEDEKTT